MEELEKPSPYLMPAAIITAGAIIAAAVVYSNKNSQGTPAAQRQATPTTDSRGAAPSSAVLSDITDSDPMLGNPDAPVTIVEFGDFQCPFCGRFFQQTLPQIKEQYVKTGKVRFVYRDFPLVSIHNEAQKSAEASECANEQGKFWPYHDLLYERQNQLGVANYKRWAEELGLNAAQFNECLDSGKYSDEVQKDYEDGLALGVSGTPGTFINGRLVAGALPFSQFATIIEEELAKTGK